MNWLFKDNINTDLITPGRYNQTNDPKELAKIAFVEFMPKFAKQVSKGDYIVAGRNFGAGSSRETAATALAHCSLTAVIATSFARIFYRNAMNVGLLCIIADTSGIDKDDKIRLDLDNLKVIVNEKIERKIEVPEMMLKLHKHGGIIKYIQSEGIKNLYQIVGNE